MAYIVHEHSGRAQKHLKGLFYRGSRCVDLHKWTPIFSSRKKQDAINFAKNNEFRCVVSDHNLKTIFDNNKPIKIR